MDSDFDSSDRARSDVRSRYPGLTLKSLFPPTSYKSRDLLPWTYQSPPWTYQSPPRYKTHHLPVETFSEIFLYTVQADPRSQANLMLVCQYWHDIMLSTPGIHSQLTIYGWTEKKYVEGFGRRWLLDVTVDTEKLNTDTYGRTIKTEFDPVEFHACFMAAAEAASRWRSLALVALPPPGECKDLQIMHPFQRLESFKLAASCNLGNFLEPLITAITTPVTARFTVMEVFHLGAALHLVQTAHVQIFSSLTTLKLRCRRMQNPVDILPSLHKLEVFEAHNLSLTIHPPGVDLPLTQTLRDLRLKAVSVQWMAGQTFPALTECSIIFPQHADITQSVYMPACLNLKYDSNNLGALGHFDCPRLSELEIKCGQSRKWRGDLQLAALHPIFAAQSLTRLRLEIKCSGWLLNSMLRLAPALHDLWLGLSSPHALSSAFFLAFAAEGRDASAGPSSQTIAPLCRRLRRLHLHYKRWSRGAERNALIPAFGAITASHPPEEQNFSFRLSFGEGSQLQEWIVHKPVERFDVEFDHDRMSIGVSSPYGIVPLSRALVVDVIDPVTESEYPPLPRESEYITAHELLVLPIDYLFSFHGLKEVRMRGLSLEIGSNTQFSPNACLFHTLKVLDVSHVPPSSFAGQTFHKLERYQAMFDDCTENLGQDLLTEMPLCTRLATSLSRLATLKLPQIRELVAYLGHQEPDSLWETHVTVNANLSGLKLLSLSGGHSGHVWPFTNITMILGSLPSLETLVIERRWLAVPYVTFFEALISVNAQETSGPNQSGWGGLCPRLESLQIDGMRLAEQLELMPVLKDIITLRANAGSPLKSFTFYNYFPQRKWELIGRHGSFIMEEVPALRFQLDI
jgi:hypothetical protein